MRMASSQFSMEMGPSQKSTWLFELALLRKVEFVMAMLPP